MNEQLTRGRLAAAGVALVAVVAVVVLVAVVAPRWWNGDGGTYAPKTTLVRAQVTPSRSLFGTVLTARARLIVDPRRVDPASVQLEANMNPFHIRSESRTVARGLGRAAEIDFTYAVQCVTRECVPLKAGKGAFVEQLTPATATYRGRDGAAGTVRVRWPVFAVQSRLTAEEIALSTPEVASAPAPPPVSWAVTPGVLGGVAIAAAALLVLGAGWLLAVAVAGNTRLVRARRIPAHLTPVERALMLAEHAAAHGEIDESRKALERLAEELRKRHASANADDAERLAWSESGPSQETVAELAMSVRSNGAR